jgi:hypothetical protein
VKDIDVIPLIVDIIQVFYSSSYDALNRAKRAAQSHSISNNIGLTIFSQMHSEVQATMESTIASFFTIEAAINYTFFTEVDNTHNQEDLDKWMKKKWKNLSLNDRLILLLSKYGITKLDKFQDVIGLFQEFVTFRNRIVHSYPFKYEALVEPTSLPNEVRIHAVDPVLPPLSQSGLSGEIARISYPDAVRCYEIMLLLLTLLDKQFILDLELAWYDNPEEMTGINIATPTELYNSIQHKYYPNIDISVFIPELPSDSQYNNE